MSLSPKQIERYTKWINSASTGSFIEVKKSNREEVAALFKLLHPDLEVYILNAPVYDK